MGRIHPQIAIKKKASEKFMKKSKLLQAIPKKRETFAFHYGFFFNAKIGKGAKEICWKIQITNVK